MIIEVVNCYLVAGSGGHPLLSLFAGGEQGGIWDLSVASSLFQSGTRASPGTAVSALNDPIGLILDQSGNNNDLAQSSATLKPLYKPNSGLPYALFDGSNDFMNVTFTLGTTWTRISALQILAFSGGNEYYFGGGNNDSAVFGNGSNHLQMYNNSAVGPEVVPSLTTDYVLTELWINPGPSKLGLDNAAYATSPSMNGVNPGGTSVGAEHAGFDPSNMHFSGLFVIDRQLSAGEIDTVQTYMGALQGRSI